ncbi:uncharacterized protein LOC124483728 [Hypomesus transpacificus]|uniref:uncharacterized protein LOC124483728 n=1 Tax=Hypomesus transpacificus TaxID=137520 RepID=UPI001F086415|nr:uncharacterized protein LOC124483728 [Hypomesus transpacificus]
MLLRLSIRQDQAKKTTREKYFFGQDIVFSPLIKDLKDLEDSGIVLKNGKVIRGCVEKGTAFYVDDYNESIKAATAPYNFPHDTTVVTNAVTVKGTKYKKGMHVVLERDDEGIHMEPEIFFRSTIEEPLSSESTDTSTTPSLPSSNSSSMNLNLNAWPENLIVPWNQMPAGIRTAIAQEKRPSAKDRRGMVLIITDKMRLTELNPSKSQCLTVAKMIVKQHPGSFADVMRYGTIIGSGYGSLLTQLQTRVEHVNRGSSLSRRRMQKRVPNSAANIPRGPVDQYGCVRWQPDCPQGETDESLKEKQNEMKDLYHVEGPAGADRGYWNVLVLDKMEGAMEKKGKLILHFFEQKPAGTNADEVKPILGMYNLEEKCDPWPVIILLLMAHFKETPEALLLQADVLATAADVEQTLQLPDSPRLIVLGGELLTATVWMLSIEGQVVVPPHSNFVAGMAALFSSYYNFNLVNQEQACCTLEFIQRCFIRLNPSSGTKATKMVTQKSGKVQEKKRNSINPHVSSLLKRVMDFEWLIL